MLANTLASPTMPELEYLKTVIEDRLISVSQKRSFHHTKTLEIFGASILLSAFTTIILGLNLPELSEAIRITALITSAILTVLNAYNTFFNNKELWVANNIARNKLYQLQFDVGFYEKANTLTAETVQNFKNRYQEIIDELNSTWAKNRTKK